MNQEVGEVEVSQVERSEFDKLRLEVEQMKASVQEIPLIKSDIQTLTLEQRLQQAKLATIEKQLDRITANTSRTLWTVIAGIIMLLINYFFNPPAPQSMELLDAVQVVSAIL